MNQKPKPQPEWTENKDLLVRIASPEVAAGKLGRSIDAVMARRRELGLPEPPPNFNGPNPSQNGKKPATAKG